MVRGWNLTKTDQFIGALAGKANTEKITINLGAVDLGKIDLLVREAAYTNRTDFIRTAIRSQLDKHQVEVQQSIARNALVVGVLLFNRRLLERVRDRGERLRITAVGMVRFANDVTPELANEAVESLTVHGMFQASDEVKAILADRMA